MPHDEGFPAPTRNLHLLCDLGITLAPQLVRLMDPQADVGRSFPGSVPLPSAFYRALSGAGALSPTRAGRTLVCGGLRACAASRRTERPACP